MKTKRCDSCDGCGFFALSGLGQLDAGGDEVCTDCHGTGQVDLGTPDDELEATLTASLALARGARDTTIPCGPPEGCEVPS